MSGDFTALMAVVMKIFAAYRMRGISERLDKYCSPTVGDATSERLENYGISPIVKIGLILYCLIYCLRGINMFQERYVYHIKDSYFAKVQDDKLMSNKENNNYRPTFFCMEDTKIPGLLWVVPMSTRVEKFTAIRDKQIEKYGKCNTIVIGSFDGKKAAFLLQNLFPITEQYLDHIHTRNGNPVPVSYALAQEVKSNLQQLRQLIYRGKKVVFPDVRRLEKLMIDELAAQNKIVLDNDLSLDERINLAKNQQSSSAKPQFDKTKEPVVR